jgi:ribose-phosphate pyrophosphokinase
MSVALFAHFDGLNFPLSMGLYPDNTPVVDFHKAWDGCHGDFRSILIRGSSIQELVAGLMVAHSVKERGGRIRQAVIPYIPGGRQDRLKWEGDWLFTLKYVAKLINDAGFDRVITVDPHSLATTALIDRLHVAEVNVKYNFGNIGYDGVIAADAGGVKRASAVADAIGVPVYFARKYRDPETNQLSGFALDDLPSNSHYLVVDDICDAGGTFVGLGEVIAENGATADLFVTHGIFSKNAVGRLEKFYNKIYSTDSLDRPVDRVNYIHISEGLARNA